MSGRHRLSSDACAHPATIQVVSNGLERVICEDCGHVSIRYESMISGDVHRSMFSRKADTPRGQHVKS